MNTFLVTCGKCGYDRTIGLRGAISGAILDAVNADFGCPEILEKCNTVSARGVGSITCHALKKKLRNAGINNCDPADLLIPRETRLIPDPHRNASLRPLSQRQKNVEQTSENESEGKERVSFRTRTDIAMPVLGIPNADQKVWDPEAESTEEEGEPRFVTQRKAYKGRSKTRKPRERKKEQQELKLLRYVYRNRLPRLSMENIYKVHKELRYQPDNQVRKFKSSFRASYEILDCESGKTHNITATESVYRKAPVYADIDIVRRIESTKPAMTKALMTAHLNCPEGGLVHVVNVDESIFLYYFSITNHFQTKCSK